LIIAQDIKEEYRFTAQDERLLSMLATQVAVVVRNARLLDATRRQARQDRLVNEITDRIRRQVDVEAILKTTTTELSRALGAHRATMRIDPQSMIASPASPWPEIAVSDPAPPATIPPDPPAGEALV
jgi:GAF domain-containing protein